MPKTEQRAGSPSHARVDEPTSHSPLNGRPRRVASAVASGHRHPGAWSPIAWFVMPGLTIGIIPRKEVIQPQLPLRLPCYDFVPITSPALDGCPPEGLAHRLQALPAFVT